jgi:hypothetical protein
VTSNGSASPVTVDDNGKERGDTECLGTAASNGAIVLVPDDEDADR